MENHLSAATRHFQPYIFTFRGSTHSFVLYYCVSVVDILIQVERLHAGFHPSECQLRPHKGMWLVLGIHPQSLIRDLILSH